MADRYQSLYRLHPNLYLEGCPVVIVAGALLKDTVTDKVLAQLKIRNLEEKNLIACKVAVRAFDSNGTELDGVSEFPYMDISVALGQDFGAKVPVYLPDSDTRRIEVSVTELIFEDDSVWKEEPCEWKELPKQAEITEYFSDPEMQKQYKMEAGEDCAFVPMIHDGIFQCTCGTINLASAQKCYKCQRSYEDLALAVDEESLLQKKNLRIEKEREETEAAEKEAEEARKKAELASFNRKRKTKKVLIAGTVVAALTAISLWVIKPAVENIITYHKAQRLLEEGAYDDAKEVFDALGDYRDASDMSKESIYQKAEHLLEEGAYDDAKEAFDTLGEYRDASDMSKQSIYKKAEHLNDSGDYEHAIAVWKSIKEYSDSEERIEKAELDLKEANYQSALENLENGEYKAAIEGFKKLGSYKDSTDLYSSTCYTYASQLAADKDYLMAIFYFDYIKGYKDADSLKIEVTYNYACDLLARGSYKDAINLFGKCSDYKDAGSKINEAKYAYVAANKNNQDGMTYNYLKDLIAAGYTDAQAIYDELYSWKATFTVLNYSADDKSTNYSSVDRFRTWVAHFVITGGSFEGSIPGSWRIDWPDGTVNAGDFDNSYAVGGDFYVYGWYNNPVFGTSGTVTVTLYAEGAEIGRTAFAIY